MSIGAIVFFAVMSIYPTMLIDRVIEDHKRRKRRKRRNK